MTDEPKKEGCETPEECKDKQAFIIDEKTFGKDFVAKLKEISGQNIDKCMQCGTCSADVR